jgi:hypothetical protein
VNEELKEQMRVWKRGHEMANEFVREENRRKTAEERLAGTLELMAAGRRLFPDRDTRERPWQMDRFQILRARVYGSAD